ncbi:hypothetical protein [Bizionia paragorgiae]|uniref:Uncharacterized protein n=1 Tax=Bizionia paragorgiae TaxID=283786 RepID=A0A1H4B987_BIZPA|nr:hypothetical protein [Bizionia paragorgiae]SEA44392.1 hypothetical protein SAMN04487990_11388 [Bizionia paragorgiae]
MNKLLIIFTLISSVCLGQNLTYQSEFDKSFKRSDYKSYISKDSIVFKIDDNIKIGKPSDLTFKNIYIHQGLGYLPMSVTENHLLDGNCKIIAISVAGTKRKGFLPYIQIRNEDGKFFSIDIEKAITSKEINVGLSENEILELLKKEKLELEIISAEEFERRKKELLKKLN